MKSMKSTLVLSLALISAASGARAQEAITSAMVPTAEGEQALRQSLVVEASLDTVWDLFTTDAGVSAWMAPVGNVNLRNGGAIRTNYDPCAAPDSSGWIENRIVNFVPRRFLTLQADLEHQREAAWMNEAIYARRADLYSVIEFEAAGEDSTRITIWGLGYGTGPEWETILSFFTAGNAWTFGQLRKALSGEEVYAPCAG